MTNKNLVANSEKLVHAEKNRADHSEVIVKKLEIFEKKLTQLADSQKNSDFEGKITSTLSDLKVGIKELKTRNPELTNVKAASSGLTDADKNFLKELSAETKDTIQDMRLEVLTASDKSKFIGILGK